jgi:energy-coupling factor transporter ATP-binding protein EcfA2
MKRFEINNFAVSGLHGEMDISVPIQDNKVVIVGVNGLGKSTFLNIFYLIVSRQWGKLVDYQFSSLSIRVNDKELSLSREEISNFLNLRRDLARALPPSRYRNLADKARSYGDFGELIRLLEESDFDQLSLFRDFGISPLEADYIRHLISRDKRTSKATRHFMEVSDYIEEELPAQVVFLPTYRRIEKDLHIVFPGLEDELKRFHEHRKRIRQRIGGQYVELVEFGMEDVDDTIKKTLANIKDTARAELNNLAGSYLRDVIRGEGRH